jgi:putative endonuclease
MTGTYEKGMLGEETALAYLLEKGYQLKERNFRAPGGEVDLILEVDGMVVFVEVKYRGHGRVGAGLESVTPTKQRRVIKAAGAYLQKTDQFGRLLRFDAVEVTSFGVIHVENAFSGEWPG